MFFSYLTGAIIKNKLSTIQRYSNRLNHFRYQLLDLLGEGELYQRYVQPKASR